MKSGKLCAKVSGDSLVAAVSKEKFENFFSDWMDEFGREKYANVASPYNV